MSLGNVAMIVWSDLYTHVLELWRGVEKAKTQEVNVELQSGEQIAQAITVSVPLYYEPKSSIRERVRGVQKLFPLVLVFNAMASSAFFLWSYLESIARP